GADAEKLAAALLQDLAERGGGEQLSFRSLDGFQVFALAGVDPPCRIDRWNVDRVAEQTVRLGIRAGDHRRRVDARDRRKNRVMRGKDNAPLPKPIERRHDLARHVIGTKTVDDDNELGVPW